MTSKLRGAAGAALIALVLATSASATRADEGGPGAPPTGSATATPAGPRRVETPNSALSFAIPPGWTTTALTSGLALNPPGNPVEETIVAACEPFRLKSVDDLGQLNELLERLRAGQLARFEESPRETRERVRVASGEAAVVTYRGSDDGGRPAVLRIAVFPAEGRVALLTARLPLNRLAARKRDLDTIVATFAPVPAASEKALVQRLAGAWRSDAVPGVELRFLADGTFEEHRGADPAAPASAHSARVAAGTFEVIGREVRLRFDDGKSRSFKVDEERPGVFVSAGQAWKRAQ